MLPMLEAACDGAREMKPVKAKNLKAGQWLAVNYGTSVRAMRLFEIKPIIYNNEGGKLLDLIVHDENDCKQLVASTPPDAVFFACDEGPEE